MEKQYELVLNSDLELLKEIFGLYETHGIAMKAINQLQEQFAKIEKSGETQKAISSFEKMLQLTMLQMKIQQKQMGIQVMKFFIILSELTANGAVLLVLLSL